MKHLFFISLISISLAIQAQDTTTQVKDSVQLQNQTTTQVSSAKANKTNVNANNGSPYILSFKKYAPVIVAGSGLTGLGISLIRKKDSLTQAELNTKTKDDIPFFDRSNVGYYNKSIERASYGPFFGAFAMPVVFLLLNNNERSHAGQVLALYLETLAVDGALWTMTAGIVNRPRPLVYGTNAPLSVRKSKNNQRSFFAGHTSAAAAASFFTAKIFSDFNPDSKAKTGVWIIAAALPAVVGYMRYQSGFHFLSDNLVGYGIGAAVGILIPQWHKSTHRNISFMPEIGSDYKGISIAYRFK